MLILSIHNKDELHKNGSKKNLVDDMIKGKKHVFILIYMEGCGPCNATRPEWSKMAQTLQKQYSKNKEIVILPCDLLEPWAPQFIYDQLKKLKIIDKVIFIITLPLNYFILTLF